MDGKQLHLFELNALGLSKQLLQLHQCVSMTKWTRVEQYHTNLYIKLVD